MNDDQLLKVIALVGNLLDGPPFVLPPDPPIKHECYGNSFEFVMHNPGWTLVHGTPMGGANLNERIGHAWAEREHNGVMWVYDPTSLYLLPADDYYRGGRINYAVRYSAIRACVMALREQTPGPWDETVINAAHVDVRPEVFWKPVTPKKRTSKKKRLDKRSSKLQTRK